jgi:CRP/FNR family transcriptional regulator, cyclic AMP receptor protein
VKQPFSVETFLATVNGGKSISKYRRNQTIFRQGELADSVFFIKEGKAKVCVVSELGKEAVVAIHGKGDFFGEGCLTGQPRRLATVTSMTECVIMRLDKAAIVRVIHDEPKFSEMFMSFLLARNARVEEDLVDQLFNSSEKRLARGFASWRGVMSHLVKLDRSYSPETIAVMSAAFDRVCQSLSRRMK